MENLARIRWSGCGNDLARGAQIDAVLVGRDSEASLRNRLGRPPLLSLRSRDRKALAKTSRRSDTESSNMPSNPRNHQYLFPFRGGNQPGSSTLHRAEMFYIAKSMPPSGPPSAAVRRHPFATPTAAAPLDLFR